VNRHIKVSLSILAGSLLFSLSFPGFISTYGIPYLSFFIIIPFIFMLLNMTQRETIFYGFIYGTLSYLLLNYWLKGFSNVAFTFAPSIMGLYNSMLFFFGKLIITNLQKNSPVPLALLFLGYEVFKGENVIGYNYGTLAHAFYRTHHFTGIVDITGTYPLTLLIIFPGIIVTLYLNKILGKKNIIIYSSLYAAVLISSILYTNLSRVNYDNSPRVRISLIQHNLDNWLTGTDPLYKEALDNLIDLSNLALDKNSELIIWSESSFVPAIEWHKEYKVNSFRLNLVNRLEEFIASSNAQFLIGANETIGELTSDQIYHNTVYHYHGSNILGKYRKIRLVPFTESFPWPEALPWLYNYTLSLGATQYTPGNDLVNFNFGNFSGTPLICYEDAFSEFPRLGVKNGSNLLINLTNDAWSLESAAPLQHLSASIFRSIENRRTFVRCGTGGFTGVIDPNGDLLASIPILTKDELTFDTPIYSDRLTFYTIHGNIIQNALIILLILFLVIVIAKSILRLAHSNLEDSTDLAK
jgi:apolipoprotein N-acyltransferase